MIECIQTAVLEFRKKVKEIKEKDRNAWRDFVIDFKATGKSEILSVASVDQYVIFSDEEHFETYQALFADKRLPVSKIRVLTINLN